MPKKTTETVEVTKAPATDQKVTLSLSELQALIASEVAKQSVKDSGVSDTRTIEALAQFSASQKAIVEQVNQRHRSLAEMVLDYPAISAFNPKGERDYPRPTHFRKVNGIPRLVRINGNSQAEHIDRMKAEEIAAFDSFTESCETRNGSFKAIVHTNGNQEILDIVLPTNDLDRRQEIGALGLLSLLFELRTQGRIKKDMMAELNQMFAAALDQDAFLANLKTVLLQGQPQTA
jgi:hypothetical protein